MTPNSTVREDAVVIALVGVAHATSHLFHLLLPPLFPLLMPDFGFGYTEAGFLMTVFFAISGLGQAFAGIVVDRYGARRVLMAGVSLLAASGVALSVAVSYPMLLLAVALAGIGNSVFHLAEQEGFTLAPGACIFGARPVGQSRVGHRRNHFRLGDGLGRLAWRRPCGGAGGFVLGCCAEDGAAVAR